MGAGDRIAALDPRAQLELFCTGRKSHPWRRLGAFVLDPLHPRTGDRMQGIYTLPTAQHGRDGTVPSHLGTRRPTDGGTTFTEMRCLGCGRHPQVRDDRLRETMLTFAAAGMPDARIDVSMTPIFG